MELYGLIGILGTPHYLNKSMVVIDGFMVLRLSDSKVSTITLTEASERGIEIIGIPSEALDRSELFYNVYRGSLRSHVSSWKLGLVPVYYTDNPSKVADYKPDYTEDGRFWEYSNDIDAKSIEKELIALEFYKMNYDSWNGEQSSKCEFALTLGINGSINPYSVIYLNKDYCDDKVLIDRNGKKIASTKYYLKDVYNWNGAIVKYLVNTNMLLVKEGIDNQVTQLIFEGIHIINPAFFE